MWGPWPDIYFCLTVTFLFQWVALSDERTESIHECTLFYIYLVYRIGDTESNSSSLHCHENDISVVQKMSVLEVAAYEMDSYVRIFIILFRWPHQWSLSWAKLILFTPHTITTPDFRRTSVFYVIHSIQILQLILCRPMNFPFVLCGSHSLPMSSFFVW
jgi:hypothetical protein